MFRLTIDFPLGDNSETAITDSGSIVYALKKALLEIKGQSLSAHASLFQYKMSKDEDRVARNYLDQDEKGHASTKKIKILI